MSLHSAENDTLLANGRAKELDPIASVQGTEASDQARARRNARQERMAGRFANVVAVLMRDPNFKSLRLADLEWMVIPPVMMGQCRVAHTAMAAPDASAKGSEMLVPVAVALWASVSADIDARLASTLEKPVTLAPSEWKTGDNVWLMAIAGDPRAIPTFLSQLEARDFKDKSVKLRARGADGKTEILSLGAFRERKAKEFSRTASTA